MKYAKVSRTSPFYTKVLTAFQKQFKNVAIMTKVYVNDNNKVFAGEWLDSNGVINFNGGYAIDAVKTTTFVD